MQGRPYTFVLEYEHSPYGKPKILVMTWNLDSDFPRTIRLIVSRTKPQAVRLANFLLAHFRNDPSRQALWAFSYFDRVLSQPFDRTPWATLDGGYLPFVHLPEERPTEAVEGNQQATV